MKVGALYAISRFKWMLPHATRFFWSNCGPILYLGEDVLIRDDGIQIVNHLVYVKGEQRILDKTFLSFLEPYDETRVT
jgi:hypothetical protein